MSIDLLVHAGTKFALEQWLDARDLGDNVQDTDAQSPTFGDYFYTHRVGTFYYWAHPSGVVPKSVDNTDPENPVVTFYSGFYAMLRFDDEIPAGLRTWTETSTATAVLDGVAGVGGEGVTILDPEDLRAAVADGGGAMWDGLVGVGNQWSDPELWAFSNVMDGDQREFGGQTYESQIDFNPWSPTQFPAGWKLVDTPPSPEIDAWVQPTGAQDSYQTGALVTHDRPQDDGNIWVFRSKIDANTTEPGRDGTFDRWWEPLSLEAEYSAP